MIRNAIVMGLALLVTTGALAQQTSRATFSALLDVQELMEAERYDEALAALQTLADRNRDRPYDLAKTLQYLAHTAMLAGRTELVRPALKQAIALPDVPPQMLAELKLYYGQVVLGDEDYALAKNLLEDWYATTERPPAPGELFVLAYANYRGGDLPRAELLLPQAIEAKGSFDERWYRVYYQVLAEQKKFAKAESVLYTLATNAPDSEAVWTLLANHYLQTEDSKRAVSAMEIANLQGMLDSVDDQQRLVSMYALLQAPEKAARVLEQQVAEGALEADGTTLRRLADLWLLARHRDTALDYLRRAANAAPDARTYRLLGSLLFEDARWTEAQAAFGRALELGGLDEPEQLELLIGVSAVYAGDADTARTALNRARRAPDLRAQADAMLLQLDR